MSEKLELKMRVDLSVIEHLGMNLYSNTPAVLSEVVANAWDADAKEVRVDFDVDNDSISVRDDGTGMTRLQVVKQYLVVGFRRREQLGEKTEVFARLPMGRKGIGKLSCFSIADTVEVYTARDRERTAFRMNAKEIQKCLSEGDTDEYPLTEIEHWPEGFGNSGTCVILSDLKKSVNQLSVSNLRKRIARRFCILGKSHQFKMFVNNEEVSVKDRDYLNHLEFIWTYEGILNEQFDFESLDDVRHREDRTNAISQTLQAKKSSIRLSGWLGTVRSPNQLKDESGQNLNRIAIFMRGKMSQEDILADYGEKRLYANYLVGEIYCEDLDADKDDDIATTSRQDLKHDDPRFDDLRAAIQCELTYIHGKWSNWRIEQGATQLVNTVPEVERWFRSLQGDTKKRAQHWIGRLNLIRSDTDTTKRELLKGSILAFESYRRKEQLDFLAGLEDEDIGSVLRVFNDIDDLQRSYYGEVVKLRIGVIDTLEEKLKANEYEKVLREHIYDHLWLIDPSWERANGTKVQERKLAAYLQTTTDGLSDDEKKARIDIGYRTSGGRHVIVELKRKSVSVPVDRLAEQIRKYRDGAETLISETARGNDWELEIICLVGKPPPEWHTRTGPEGVKRTLAAVGARLVFYDDLLDNARQAYKDYLETHIKVDPLWQIFRAIDDFSVSEGE